MDCELSTREAAYRLLFEPVFVGGPTIEFRCNAAGEVDLDALDEEERTAYFRVRFLRRLHLAPRVIAVDQR